MTCKPYTHFKMFCYTCECNGDGIAECDATACGTEALAKSAGKSSFSFLSAICVPLLGKGLPHILQSGFFESNI